MSKIYIAGPYTKPDPAVNVRNAILAADQVRALGATVFLPHLYHFWHLVSPHEYEYWMSLDLEWLKECDALYLIPGESPGARTEIERCNELSIPVLVTLEQVRWFVETRTREIAQ